jgi:hypothetical protein
MNYENIDNSNLSDSNKPKKSIICRLKDLNSQAPIPHAYIVVETLGIELSSNELGAFKIDIPSDYKPNQLEILIMPTYYEYRRFTVDINVLQPIDICMETVLSLKNIFVPELMNNSQAKSDFRHWIKSMLFF